jgi:hypothetical protein
VLLTLTSSANIRSRQSLRVCALRGMRISGSRVAYAYIPHEYSSQNHITATSLLAFHLKLGMLVFTQTYQNKQKGGML